MTCQKVNFTSGSRPPEDVDVLVVLDFQKDGNEGLKDPGRLDFDVLRSLDQYLVILRYYNPIETGETATFLLPFGLVKLRRSVGHSRRFTGNPLCKILTISTLFLDSDTYLHRVARAGRFGTKGLAISFIADDEDEKIQKSVQERFEVTVTELPDEIDISTYIEGR